MASSVYSLGGVLRFSLACLDESGDRLGPLRGAFQPGVERREFLDQKAAEAVENDFVVEKRIELLGDDLLEPEDVQVDRVAEAGPNRSGFPG